MAAHFEHADLRGFARWNARVWGWVENPYWQFLCGEEPGGSGIVCGDPAGLLDLDRELGVRTFVVPPPLAGKL